MKIGIGPVMKTINEHPMLIRRCILSFERRKGRVARLRRLCKDAAEIATLILFGLSLMGAVAVLGYLWFNVLRFAP